MKVYPVSCKPPHYRTISVANIISETVVNINIKKVKSVKRVWFENSRIQIFYFIYFKLRGNRRGDFAVCWPKQLKYFTKNLMKSLLEQREESLK